MSLRHPQLYQTEISIRTVSVFHTPPIIPHRHLNTYCFLSLIHPHLYHIDTHTVLYSHSPPIIPHRHFSIYCSIPPMHPQLYQTETSTRTVPYLSCTPNYARYRPQHILFNTFHGPPIIPGRDLKTYRSIPLMHPQLYQVEISTCTVPYLSCTPNYTR